jgi:hypothetical protein
MISIGFRYAIVMASIRGNNASATSYFTSTSNKPLSFKVVRLVAFAVAHFNYIVYGQHRLT